MKTALTIAGSDSGGGAGIQADLKTFSAHHVFGMSVITAVTAQNTVEVRSIQSIDTDIIADQIAAVFDDITVDAVKIGMLGSSDVIETVANKLNIYKPTNIVLDPVMIAKSGDRLLSEDAIATLKTNAFATGYSYYAKSSRSRGHNRNKIETKQDLYTTCQKLHELGAKNVLLKGGHSLGNPNDLFYDGENFHWLKAERIPTKNTHGTGCTLSSAIASNLANGLTLKDSIEAAKTYITEAIRNSFPLGHGHGPVHHFYSFEK